MFTGHESYIALLTGFVIRKIPENESAYLMVLDKSIAILLPKDRIDRYNEKLEEILKR